MEVYHLCKGHAAPSEEGMPGHALIIACFWSMPMRSARVNVCKHVASGTWPSLLDRLLRRVQRTLARYSPGRLPHGYVLLVR